MNRLILAISLLFLAACQTKPTKVFEQGQTKMVNGLAVDESTVIVDARPSFDYQVAHIAGSIPMRWEDFSQREEAFKGLLEEDLFFHARRLARLGIGQQTPVIVVGRGPAGGGEEARLAWTLKVMGMDKVSFTHIDSFNMPLQTTETPARAPVPIWKPRKDDSLLVSKKEFLRAALRTQSDVVVIDCRTEREYLGKGSTYVSKRAPNLETINIPWTQFMNSSGEPNPNIKERLKQVGITEDRKIFVISEQGVRSAAVTLILRDLGFAFSANFAGGYRSLLAREL